MQPRYRRFILVGALGGLAQLNPPAALAAQAEKAPQIIAAQLHRQGVACTTPRAAVQDTDTSTPLETVWTLRCDEATYRVTLVPHLGARITPLCRSDPEEDSAGPERLGNR